LLYFFVIVKWVVQSSFKIDWFSFFLLLKFFLCSGESGLLSEMFQSCYFIYFFQIIRGVKGEGI